MLSLSRTLARPIPGKAIQLALVLGAAVASVLSATDTVHGTTLGWLAELAASLLPLAVLLALLAYRTPRRYYIGTLASLLALGVFVSPTSLRMASGKEAGMTVVSANLGMKPPDRSLLESWAKSAAFVVLLEVTPDTGAQLSRLEEWPHKVIVSEDSPFGIALLSKYPLTLHSADKSDAQPEVIRAVAKVGTSEIPFVAIHPMPPISPAAHVQRDALIVREAKWLLSQGGGIMAGDLNTTPWGSAMHKANSLGLKRAHSWSATWPTPFTIFGIGIGIDHVLATADHWCVMPSTVGRSKASDHAPILAALHWCGGGPG